MKRVTHWHRRGLSLVAITLILPVAMTSAPGGSGEARANDAQPDRAAHAQAAQPTDAADAQASKRLSIDELPRLAEAGKFEQLLAWLEEEFAASTDTSVRSLISDLQRYHEHRLADDARREESHKEAMDKVREAFDDERLEDALVAAIDAHALAADPRAMLRDDLVRDIVAQAEHKAAEARDQNHWVEALSLYRLLDLLFEDQGKYRDEIDEVNQHVRVLRIYAPKTLRELHRTRAERRQADQDAEEAGASEDAFEPPTIDLEPWDEQIDEVGLGMLRQALQQSAIQHITSEGYAPLMRGAIDALMVFLRTDALADTFPSLNDQAKRDQFLEYLEQVSGRVAPREQDEADGMGWLRAATMIDQIMAMNQRTLDLPARVLIYEMTEGATGALDDFSGVIWPRQTETFTRSTQGRFYGVGIQISRRDGRLVVVSPLLNTPAQQAGIKAGDIIAEVDGHDTSTWSLDKAVREITGPKGTDVTLSVERRGEPELIEYALTRAEIEIESIRGWEHTRDGDWDYFIDRDHRIGYVRLTQFIPQTAGDLDAAVEKMERDGPLNGLVLDLRFNPGGLLSSATDVADRFIDEGPLVFTVNAEGRHTDERRAQRHRTYKPFPVVLLVNQGSASGSEIVAGALQDHRRAVVVGTRSFGKGSVQDLFPLDRGRAYLKLTTQHYKLPQGRIIHRQPGDETWGVEPDLLVEMTDRQVADAIEFRQKVDVLRDADDEDWIPAQQILDDGLDPQLEAGLLVLKARLAARQIAMAERAERRRAAHRDEQ